MNRLVIGISVLMLLAGWEWIRPTEKPAVTGEMPVADVLTKLGEEPYLHQVDPAVPGVSAERGREIVQTGITDKPNGGKISKQSKNFVCTACHNIQKEDPDLSVSDPEARLKYVKENGMPFLQGTTLYGAVNRTTFYNGDYEKKYGDLVKDARNSLRGAIQLCAIECSQGRALEEWEMESVLAYLWKIGLKMEDLELSDREYAMINNAADGKGDNQKAIELIKSKYLSGSPATFVDPPKDRKEGYPLQGNPENGKLIYDLSCLHCHEVGRFAFFHLDDSDFSFNFLEKHFPKYTRYSTYQVARYGTSPVPGKRTYMPNYTKEKMSDQQMEDLRAYIEMKVQ